MPSSRIDTSSAGVSDVSWGSAGWFDDSESPHSSWAAASGVTRRVACSGANSPASAASSGRSVRTGFGGPEPSAVISWNTSVRRRWMIAVAGARRSASGRAVPIAAISAAVGPGSRIVATAASTSSSLSENTRKMVPSAMPAASAICRVVSARPCSLSSGTVAATIAARRSSADIGSARPRRRTSWVAAGMVEHDSRVSEDSLSGRFGRRPTVQQIRRMVGYGLTAAPPPGWISMCRWLTVVSPVWPT